MNNNITKDTFLKAISCPLAGWLAYRDELEEPVSDADRLRFDQGNDVTLRARQLYPKGTLISDIAFEPALKRTAPLLAGSGDITLFEPAFRTGLYAARADILRRAKGAWHLIEVKSSTEVKDEHIDDIAYTAAVMAAAGIQVRQASLLTISKDYRLGMPDKKLFTETDVTEDIADQVAEYASLFPRLQPVLTGPRPKEKLIYACKDCPVFGSCAGENMEYPLFDLPGIREKLFQELTAQGIFTIPQIPDTVALKGKQATARACVVSGKPFAGPGLQIALDTVRWPAYYLDFETMSTTIPLYPDTAPYAQLVTQFSIHVCEMPGVVKKHIEYLADHARDCRREVAEKLLGSLGTKGSVLVYYAPFESGRIKEMAAAFPDLADGLNAILDRMVDLFDIVKDHYYDRAFQGSFSIKQVLPVLVPGMDYTDLEIQEGGTALALFTRMALGEITDPKEVARIRKNLLAYCERDTLAMVKLHEKLLGLYPIEKERMDERKTLSKRTLPPIKCNAYQRIVEKTDQHIAHTEQMIEICKSIAGFSAAESDQLRKDINSLHSDNIRQHRAAFIAAAQKRGFSKDIAAAIFEKLCLYRPYRRKP